MSTTELATRKIDPATVLGWGVDADPRNDPTYPYRHRVPNEGHGMDWARPVQQAASVEVLRSIEHNRLPAVVGTSTPPSGLSGSIRRIAFRFSESDWTHWLMLLAADRVNMIEGVVQDLGHGRIPNVPAEMGFRSAWRYDRERVVTKAVIVTGISILAISFFVKRSRDHRGQK